MKKILLLFLVFTLAGCADYSMNPSVNGLRSPNDVVPQPFPSPAPDSH
jgi:hypothetical protein